MNEKALFPYIPPDGYPCRYELYGVTIEEVVGFLSQYDKSNFDWSAWNP